MNDGTPFITSPIVDLKVVAPTQATSLNASATGLGQGAWQAVGDVHGFQLPPGAGSKTIYVQFRDSLETLLAAITKSVILLEPGFAGDLSLVLNDADDTFVFSNSANENFAGQATVSAGRYDTGYDYWGLFRFTIPKVPAGVQVTVKSAVLGVYLVENTRNTSQTITPYEPDAAWAENTVTWASRPALGGTAVGAGLLFTGRGEVNRWKTFQLDAQAIQRWFQNPMVAHGLALTGQGTPGLTSVQVVSSESFKPTEDRRPRLVVTLGVSMTDTTPPAISGVQAVSVGEVGATIQWTTDEAADGLAEYGPTTAYGQTAPAQTSLSTTHAVQLSGLSSRTTYHVRVTSRDATGNASQSADLSFITTGPLSGDVNRDGQRTAADIAALLSQLLGLSPVTPEVSDVNGDGKVTVADLQSLANLP